MQKLRLCEGGLEQWLRRQTLGLVSMSSGQVTGLLSASTFDPVENESGYEDLMG